ncbi:hypothetical protein JQ561_14735 [Bradyrhizobium diazoefficiens]|uniref:hypothetical protein n=1 Tax=Bradyrhizobium sp. WYCCWR 12699 TaxID=3064203 RepID=UPI001BA96CB8|nr:MULTISPECIES: hypothetical protein [Bradyrhizobium]MBR0927865.1 hypothetical protein [Bradyrhizobium diazoefficiens]MDT4742637.1 hypothetical protein [Bradyrhizobium sp. WYCCWR 12699]
MLIKALALATSVIVVQQTAVKSPPVDGLHLAINAAVAAADGDIRTTPAGCKKDELARTICTYQLSNGVSVKALAREEKGPIKSIDVELPGGKEAASKLFKTTALLAMAFVPDVPDAELNALMNALVQARKNMYGDASQRYRNLDFSIKLDDKRNTLVLIVD